LYKIRDQVIFDDEYHALNVALNHDYLYIATHYHESDNCIPLTLLYRQCR